MPERFAPSQTTLDAALADRHMLVITGERERTAREYRELLAAAGSTMVSMTATGAAESLIEAAAARVAQSSRFS